MSDHLSRNPQAAAFSAAYTYRLTDYQALRRAKRALNPFDNALWKWRYVWTLGFSVAVLLFTILDQGMGADQVLSWTFLSTILPIFAGLILFIALVDVVFDRILTPWVFKRYSMANRLLNVWFNDGGIQWSSEGFKGEIAWSKVRQLITLENYLFLFISKMEAIGIPQHALASKDAFDSLIQYAKERVNG